MPVALNGLRVSAACSPDVGDLGGAQYQPTLQVVGKGDKPAEVPLNPRTHEAIDQALQGRTEGPLLLNRMQRHNAAGIVTKLARRVGVERRVTPHALRRSYITIGLLRPVVPPRPDLRPHDRHRTLSRRRPCPIIGVPGLPAPVGPVSPTDAAGWSVVRIASICSACARCG